MSSVTTIGREPLTVVEIDQDKCSRTYGVAPCQAVLGVTGDHKCYNTIQSCQDEDNFALGDPLTLRFCTAMESTGLPKSLTVIPSLVSVSSVATRINIAAGDPGASPLGQRASVTLTFRDHPYHDRLVDPYHASRTFDPMARGTFWSKWLARNPYYQGRPIRILEGYVGQALAEMRERSFIIERIEGPSNGIVSVIAKDPIKLLDNVRVRAPAPNSGTMVAEIDENDGSLLLEPNGIGNTYSTSGVIRVGGELMTFTRSPGSELLTLTERGFHNTVAATHGAGDLVQECLVISNQRVDSVLADLMTEAGIDPAHIPAAEWDAEGDLWFTAFNLNAIIPDPTGVAALIAEILANTGCFLWWDDEGQAIRLKATRPFFPLSDAAAVELEQNSNVVADSLEIERLPDERITKIYMYWNIIDPTGAVDEPSNYSRRLVLTDDDSEEPIRYGDSRIKRIFCRFFDDTNDAAPNVVSSRILERFRETPRLIKFETDAKETVLRAGTVIRLTHDDIVDLTGEAEPTLLQITAREEVDSGHRFAFEARPYLDRSRYCFIMADGSPTHDASPPPDEDGGGWIVGPTLSFADGSLPFRIL